MTIKEQLRANFPNSIDKTKPEFCALVANDKGNAAVEAILTDLLAYMREWKNSKNIYEQTGVMLDKSSAMITYLERFTDETDEQYKNRINAIFVRHNDTVWGTPYNIKRVFEQYFSLASVFVVENTGSSDENLIEDFDFDTTESDNWTLTNAEICIPARFSKTFGVKFNSGGNCKQTVTKLTGKLYYLHLFHKGNIRVTVQDNTGLYWTGDKWQSGISYITRNGTEWQDSQVFIKLADSMNSITVTFFGDENTYMDYVRLTEYKFPSFTVFIQMEGSVVKNALALAPGKEDPHTPLNYDLAGYYDQGFLTGVAAGFAKDLYEDLLSYIKAEGVKAYLEIVNKDYSDNE